jgi:signal transduction histidine kinase
MGGDPDTSSVKRLSQSLSFKQVRVAVFAALVLGICFSALQIAADLRNELREVDTTYEQALKAFEESAFQAAFGLDDVLARTVVRGLFQQEAIFEARIIDNFGDTMVVEKRPQRQGTLKWLADSIFGRTKTFAIPLQSKGTAFHAGDLSIQVDLYIIAQSFFQRSGLILVFGIIRNLFLAIILAMFFHYMLTKPLRDMAASIKMGRDHLDMPANHESDELGDIVNAHNELSQQRAEATARLRDEESRFRDLFQNTEVAIWNVDLSKVHAELIRLRRDGVQNLGDYLEQNRQVTWQLALMNRILGANEATLALFGADTVDDFREQLRNSIGPESINVYIEALQAIWDNQPVFRTEATYHTSKGEEINTIVTFRMPRTVEGFRSIPISFVDITERRRAEEDRRLALIDAEHANQAKSDFLATMSHELRTPLNAIIGFSDMIEGQFFGKLGSEKYLEYAHDIHNSSEHLLALVNDILDLSAIEAGKQPLVMEELVVREVAADCTPIIINAAFEKNISFSVEISDDLPPLLADRRAVKQILFNLLSNAVKYTTRDGKIVLKATAANGGHVLEVVDTGIGVPSEKLPGLTDPFVRSESDPHMAQEGSGLGLAIVKSLVDLHGGNLDIASEVGVGTSVSVYFPGNLG